MRSGWMPVTVFIRLSAAEDVFAHFCKFQAAPIRLAEVGRGRGNFSSVQPFCPRCIQVIFFGVGSPVRSPPVRLTNTVSLTGKDLLRTCLMSPAIAVDAEKQG